MANTSYYLYIGDYYSTITPFESDPYDMGDTIFVIRNDGELDSFWDLEEQAVTILPVISLKNEAKVKSGTGLYNDPYIIKTN